MYGYITGDTPGHATYKKDLGSEKPNCWDWQDLALEQQTASDNWCNLQGATMSVTASSPPCDEAYTPPANYSAYATYCSDCGSTWPTTVYVTISGLTENSPYGGCAECTWYNTTFALVQNDAWCGHSVFWSPARCCYIGMVADWVLTNGQVGIRVGLHPGTGVEYVEWIAYFNLGVAPVNCSTFNEQRQNIHWFGPTSGCACGIGPTENATLTLWW